MISTCFKSRGGVCNNPSPLAAPAKTGNPSFNICVYLPSNPCMRIDAFPDVAEVCWVIIPVLSFSNIRMSPGFMLPFSPSSSLEINSTRVGMF